MSKSQQFYYYQQTESLHINLKSMNATRAWRYVHIYSVVGQEQRVGGLSRLIRSKPFSLYDLFSSGK
jgi:hypothetical protein